MIAQLNEQLNEHGGFELSLVFCVVSILGLSIFVILIWAEAAWAHIHFDKFRRARMKLAGFAAVYALWCFWRLTENVAMPRELHPEFVPELIAISVFWVLAPPIWFFVEYFAVERDRITNLSGAVDLPAAGAPANELAAALATNEAAKAKYLKTIKEYADYASKIWAGVLALLLALIALKK
jgi:hypothetical protein